VRKQSHELLNLEAISLLIILTNGELL